MKADRIERRLRVFMQKIGEITAVKGDRLEVTFCRPADCGHCHACEGGQKETVVTVEGAGRVGDYAAVELPANTVVKATFLAYFFPIIGLLGGALLGDLISGHNAVWSAVGGLVCLLLTWLTVVFTEKYRLKSAKWKPVLYKVFPREMYEDKKGEES